MPALSFVADVQDSSWGGRGSPGNRRSPCSLRRRRSPQLSARRQQQQQQQQQQVQQQQQQQQHPVHKQRNARERPGNENSPIRKEIYRETHGFHNQHNQQNHQHHHIEVGSEILVPAGACLTDDNVRQKLDSGAILVHGKEELPLGYNVATTEDNNRKRRPYSAGHLLNHEHRLNGLENDDEERRRLSDDELLRVRRADGRRRLRSAGSDHEDYANNGLNKNKNDEPIRDKNANARVTRANSDAAARRQSATLPRRRRRRALSGSFAGNPLPPHRVTPDGTAIYYWCELPRRPGSQELDDGAYNPLWTMRGFTQTFHFWKETKRAQSVPLNAFLTYITLPWWSIAKDILDHREGPILTF